MAVSSVGLFIAAFSAFFNGTFPAWQRCSTESDPILFNCLVCLGAFLSSVPVPAITGRQYVFNPLGFCSGALFVFAILLSFIAIPKAGLATSQAVWSTSAIMVSFAWGSFGPDQIAAPMASLPLSLLALILLIAGALVVVFSQYIANRIISRKEVREVSSNSVDIMSHKEVRAPEVSSNSTTVDIIEDAMDDVERIEFSCYEDSSASIEISCHEDSSTSLPDQQSKDRQPLNPTMHVNSFGRVMGLVSAAVVGLFGGSVLVPSKFVPEEEAGLSLLPSFGLGALVVGATLAFCHWLICRRNSLSMPGVATVAAGIMSGVTWNAGNVCSIVAQSPPFEVPYGVAYPILQCAVLFGGIWGIFMFHEIRGAAVGVFWVGASILTVGIMLLSMYGPGSKEEMVTL